MAAKTEVKKEVAPTRVLDLSIERAICLERANEVLEKENEALKEEVSNRDSIIGSLQCDISRLENQHQPTEGVTLSTSIRNQLLFAMAPSVVPNGEFHHAHTRAQDALKAVDEIMKVWGME